MILKLLPDTDPKIKQVSEPFNFDDPQMDPLELYNNLADTMCSMKGIGLSAIQAGIPLRVFVIGDPNQRESVIPVFNPKIVSVSEEKDYYEEGCLTFNGLWVKIKRPLGIRARFKDVRGRAETKKFSGLTARVFQHEYDHLDGIIFKERASKYHLDQAMRKLRKSVRRK